MPPLKPGEEEGEKKKQREGRGRTRQGSSALSSPTAAYLFPLLSLSMALPITLDLVSSSCTSSNKVFL